MKIKLGSKQPTPEYKSKGAAAFDLRATDTLMIRATPVMMDLDIALEIPEGYYGKLVVRSSMSKRGIRLANAVGIIDSCYRGNIHAPLYSNELGGSLVEKGERIVQVLILPVVQVSFEVVDELEETERGSGGFGSTGKF